MAELAEVIDQDISNPYTDMTVEQLVHKLKTQREIAGELSQKLKNAQYELRQIEDALIEYSIQHPEIEGTKIKGVGTVHFRDETVYNVSDWNEMYQYIKDHDAFYLLHRRISNPSIRELLGTGEKLPVTSFTRKKIGLTSS